MLKSTVTPSVTPVVPAVMSAVMPLAAMLFGGLLGTVCPGAASIAWELTDPLVLVLVTLLFLTLPSQRAASLTPPPVRAREVDAVPNRPVMRLMVIAWAMNFLLIPIVAVALTALLLPNSSQLRLGVLIYMLFPCTDWFLGFTRLARGDTVTGAALIPLNMATQLALYPLYVSRITGSTVASTVGEIGPALLHWFALPAACAIVMRMLLAATVSNALRARLLGALDRFVAPLITLLILTIFSSHGTHVVAEPVAFSLVLLTVFVFFVVVYWIGRGVSSLAGLSYPAHALLTMTTSARNAPLMLGLTALAMPDQPMVQAAIVLGMLIEFPHLTVVTQLLLRSRDHARSKPAVAPAVGI